MTLAAIIDSDAVSREMVSDILTDIGIEFDEYDSSEAVSEALATYDVYVVEMLLPGMDGVQLCQQIRSRTDAPIVVFSGHDDMAWKTASFFAGADDYIVKPMDPCEIKLRILSALRRAKS